MANHPLVKDVKNWILDSFSFMDGIGYDVVFDDDIYGMENTKAISADIDGLTDFDFEKGKKNLLNSIPNKIKAEFPYLRITSGKDGHYFIMYIVLLDNNDYLEDKNIQYINLNESKESSRKSLKESEKPINEKNVAKFVDEVNKWCDDNIHYKDVEQAQFTKKYGKLYEFNYDWDYSYGDKGELLVFDEQGTFNWYDDEVIASFIKKLAKKYGWYCEPVHGYADFIFGEL